MLKINFMENGWENATVLFPRIFVIVVFKGATHRADAVILCDGGWTGGFAFFPRKIQQTKKLRPAIGYLWNCSLPRRSCSSSLSPLYSGLLRFVCLRVHERTCALFIRRWLKDEWRSPTLAHALWKLRQRVRKLRDASSIITRLTLKSIIDAFSLEYRDFANELRCIAEKKSFYYAWRVRVFYYKTKIMWLKIRQNSFVEYLKRNVAVAENRRWI